MTMIVDCLKNRDNEPCQRHGESLPFSGGTKLPERSPKFGIGRGCVKIKHSKKRDELYLVL